MANRAELNTLPLILALGDHGLLVRFSDGISAAASLSTASLSRRIANAAIAGVLEIAPGLVSVFVRYDPSIIGFSALAGEIRLLVATAPKDHSAGREHKIAVRFGGDDGPDLEEAAHALAIGPDALVAAHTKARLRVLATGFAPGFVYCGLHPEALRLPRRADVRPSVPAGSILFAAGQTAITATIVPTGWHVIGRTNFRNFDPYADPPTRLMTGDTVRFQAP